VATQSQGREGWEVGIMPKKKSKINRRTTSDYNKNIVAITKAWIQAGRPKEGVVIDGMLYRPLPFPELDTPEFEAFQQPFRIRVTAGKFAGLYVSRLDGEPLGFHSGQKYFLNEQQQAAVRFVPGFSEAVVTKLILHLHYNGCPTEFEAVKVKEAAKAGK
jgi:hypothetical protein